MSDYTTQRAVFTPAGYDRIYVDGVDVTRFRDTDTVIGDVLLTEPFAYGPTSLSFPQIDGNLEPLGVGELSWVREDATVVIQRVDDPTSETPTILATDYRGYVLAIDVEGRNLTLEVGGQFSGPASLINVQRPLRRRLRDVGLLAAEVTRVVRLKPAERFGPTTGIKIVADGGGSTLLAWAGEICAWSQTNAGVQRTIMPTVWGGNRWGFAPKDTTTRDVTLFTDDARVVPRLRRDRAEQPNTFFGTCVTPDGVLIDGSLYPGLFQGTPPTFPGSMSLGDVDADTTTGSGVSVLNDKLLAMNFLDLDDVENVGTFDADTQDAVKELQRKAGLSATGVVNEATWKRLFDIDATGWSLEEARIAPMVQDPAIPRNVYTANGSLAGRNPDHDPSVLRVDRNVDGGPGVTERALIRYLRGQATKLSGPNWVGTITLNGGFGGFAGDWDTSDYAFLNDPATGVAHIMSQLDIRPGMNAWLPMFDGGTLVHISSVNVNRASRTVTLTVDTLARDYLELAAIVARNKESQRSIRREWHAENRPGRRSGNMIVRNKWFGKLDRDLALEGDKWNVFPMVVGQHGQVGRVRVRTVDDKAVFAVAVFSTKVTRKKLNRRVGNPLTVTGGESAWEKEALQDWFEDRNLLYAVGDENQPCGYFPRRFKGDDGEETGAPITGRHDDTQTWPYICSPNYPAIVWMAVYPDRDCTLRKGQILWPQMDDAI